MIAIDTNILIYAFDKSDPARRATAATVLEQIISSRRAVIPLKVMEEFSEVATRKGLLDQGALLDVLSKLQVSFLVAETNIDDIFEAVNGKYKYHLQYWDAIIWATAKRTGCTVLLSEDGPTDATIGGVTWVNPFGPKGLLHPKLKRALK